MSNLKFEFVTAPPVTPENNTVYLVRSPAGGDFRFMVKGPEGIAIETTVSKQEFLALNKTSVGLGNVDNTTDANKPISTATQTALNGKAPLTGAGASGTWPISVTGSAGVLASTDSRSVKPNAITSYNARTFFASKTGMEGGAVTTDWVDLFAFNTYGDGSGGLTNALAFNKAGAGLWHYQGAFNSAAWNAPKQIAYTDSSITGNAATATKLATARAINGVNFDGTANITVVDATKEPAFAAGTAAQYRRGDKTWQTLNKSAVGLANVDNTSDANKPVSSAQQTALNAKINNSEKAIANGVATLGADGKIPTNQLPALAITDTFTAINQTGMLGLTAQVGDIAIRTDINRSFVLSAEPASTLANWKELLTPTDAVLSVAGRTGAVVLTKTDVGLGNVPNVDTTNAGNISSGTLPDARLPTRFGLVAKSITDWNLAIHNGWYMGADIANAPGAGLFIGTVAVHIANLWCTQTVHAFSTDSNVDTKTWRREQNNGTWTSWYRLRISQEEQAALWAPKNNPTFTGQVIVPEGTSSVPGIAFANDGAPDTGFYHVSDGVFGATANTVPVATFQTAGVELLQTPKAPTAAPGTNTTQIATTAFVLAALSGGSIVHVTTASATAAPKNICSLDFAGVTTLTFPLNPSEGTLVTVVVGNGRLDNLINPNGKTIMNVAGLMTIDKIDFPTQFLFINNTWKIL